MPAKVVAAPGDPAPLPPHAPEVSLQVAEVLGHLARHTRGGHAAVSRRSSGTAPARLPARPHACTPAAAPACHGRCLPARLPAPSRPPTRNSARMPLPPSSSRPSATTSRPRSVVQALHRLACGAAVHGGSGTEGLLQSRGQAGRRVPEKQPEDCASTLSPCLPALMPRPVHPPPRRSHLLVRHGAGLAQLGEAPGHEPPVGMGGQAGRQAGGASGNGRRYGQGARWRPDRPLLLLPPPAATRERGW